MVMTARAYRHLRDLISEKSLIQDQNFTLSSGAASNYFFNMKISMLDPMGSNLIADAMLDILDTLDFDSVGGMAVGSVPLVTSIATKSYLRSRHYPAFFVRKEVKDHGVQTKIDGHCTPGSRVVLVEDVTTTGGSIMRAVEAVREIGCQVDTVLTVVDRLEGARENLSAEKIRLIPLYTQVDFEDS
jgi:orotate phosphoribosyltransferase